MNFDNIAELVHELAKNPNRSSVIIPQFRSTLTDSELDAITKVFSKEELSSNSLAAIVSPTRFWF